MSGTINCWYSEKDTTKVNSIKGEELSKSLCTGGNRTCPSVKLRFFLCSHCSFTPAKSVLHYPEISEVRIQSVRSTRGKEEMEKRTLIVLFVLVLDIIGIALLGVGIGLRIRGRKKRSTCTKLITATVVDSEANFRSDYRKHFQLLTYIHHGSYLQ